MIALVVGRFHALTSAQEAALAGAVAAGGVERVVAVLTQAGQQGTRRNPFDAATREALLRPALARLGKPFAVVPLDDVAEDAAWVPALLAAVARGAGVALAPAGARVLTANREVRALFEAAGFPVEPLAVAGPTPLELLERAARAQPWEADATPETRALLGRPEVRTLLQGLFAPPLVNQAGELAHARDFDSYGAQMDASLRQKLEDLWPWVRPGRVVDKGCGTGALLVELSRRLPGSALVGVDLSQEFLRRCDENTYLSQDVRLVRGDVIEPAVTAGTATTVIFSSVMHEVYTYTGYRLESIDRALASAASELGPGGRVLIRDGVSPPPATVRLELLDQATVDTFRRFEAEFAHGRGVQARWRGPAEVELSAHDANEFLCKKDYLRNWHIEVHEEYGALTLEGWGQALARAGLQPLHLHSYVNPWIAGHRYQGRVRLTDLAGAALPWPATNCVVVGEKPDRAAQ